jgi:uncharacterized hydrophobic protein (TIGR00271 family)
VASGETPTTPDPDGSRLAERPTTSIFGFELVPITRDLLGNTHVIRAAAGLVVGLVILFWPSRTDKVLGALVGVAFIIMSSMAFIEAIRGRRPRGHIPAAILGLLIGVVLVVDLRDGQENLGEIIGLAMIVIAIRDRPRRDQLRRRERLARSLAFLAIGALTIAFPGAVLDTATTFVVVGWIVLSATAIVVALDARRTEPASYDNAIRAIVQWFNELSSTYPGRGDLAGRLTFTGRDVGQRIIRFYVLMTFASVIAAMGVITDSTAVVIGAMLIAPLMTPLMGMAMSLAMGWPNRLGRTGIVAVGGIVLAIGIGLVLGWLAPTVIDTTTNGQITSRSEPNVLDLIIAVAAGGAGAYGLSRPDVSDALPGVAIAIALVPPLAVTGICYSQGDVISGNGALLLFGTNAVAILIVGGITFVFTGVVPLSTVTESQRRLTTAISAVVVLAALVVGALLLNGRQAATDLLRRGRVEATVEDWVNQSERHRLQDVILDGDLVIVDILGPPIGVPSVDDLSDDLTDEFGRTIDAEVRLTVEQIYTSATTLPVTTATTMPDPGAPGTTDPSTTTATTTTATTATTAVTIG